MLPELQRVLQRLAPLKDWEARGRARMAEEVSTAPCRDLCRRLGYPQHRYRVVHISGSKGKGTVGALLGVALGAAGWRVGVMSSPHVEHLTERLRLGGTPIDEPSLAAALAAAAAARDAAAAEGTAGRAASWFDVFVAGSFEAMARGRADWAVVECGLGGRRDSTNVVASLAAVLTSVEREHTEVLGEAVRQIAREKAAIVRAGAALLAAVDGDAAAEVRRVARERRAGSVTLLPPAADALGEGGNVALARLVLDELGRRGARVAGGATRLHGGLLSARLVARAAAWLPARQESRAAACGTPVLLDGAHTPRSVRALVARVRGGAPPPAAAGGGAPVVLLGMMEAKEAEEIVKGVAEAAPRHVVCCSLDARGDAAASGSFPPRELARLARGLGVASSAFDDAAEALECALQLARESRAWVLVIGSFRLCGYVRKRMVPLPECDEVD
ncbi:hypothetical protein AB1Y20_004464 [Prymnesium parvum]|uniref:Mur ligase C-terminal domain-containing protein n=1 Tax=Prymnesium parvum TaxID=97485 RepID=A0AB34IZB4_PRYPA